MRDFDFAVGAIFGALVCATFVLWFPSVHPLLHVAMLVLAWAVAEIPGRLRALARRSDG